MFFRCSVLTLVIVIFEITITTSYYMRLPSILRISYKTKLFIEEESLKGIFLAMSVCKNQSKILLVFWSSFSFGLTRQTKWLWKSALLWNKDVITTFYTPTYIPTTFFHSGIWTRIVSMFLKRKVVQGVPTLPQILACICAIGGFSS